MDHTELELKLKALIERTSLADVLCALGAVCEQRATGQEWRDGPPKVRKFYPSYWRTIGRSVDTVARTAFLRKI